MVSETTIGAGGYANITLTRDGAVARLTFNRPDRRNALTHAMMLELEDAFVTLRDDVSCRVVVLRGAGGHFCAGGDLDAMADMPPRPANGGKDPLVPAYRQFGNAVAVPVVAKIAKAINDQKPVAVALFEFELRNVLADEAR